MDIVHCGVSLCEETSRLDRGPQKSTDIVNLLTAVSTPNKLNQSRVNKKECVIIQITYALLQLGVNQRLSNTGSNTD